MYESLMLSDQMRQMLGWNEPLTYACANAVISPVEDRDKPQLKQRILVGERASGGSHAVGATQCIHGGYINPKTDRSAAHTARREPFEETGLEIARMQFLGVAGPRLWQSVAQIVDEKLTVVTVDKPMNPSTPIVYQLFRGWHEGHGSLTDTAETKGLRFVETGDLIALYGEDQTFRSWHLLDAILRFDGTPICL